MDKLVDLHTHSTVSDGSMSPMELVRHAKESGLAAIALTDHDTVEGVESALGEGKSIGLEVIPGVEIGVEFKPEMHILGYFIDTSRMDNIGTTLAVLRKNRDERNPRIINKLNEMGFSINIQEVEREAAGAIVGRPHIARVMVEKGYAGSMQEAFELYLSAGRPAYFKKDRITPEQGIKEILGAGGIPVLAHPKYLGLEPEQLDKLLLELAGWGLRGIEAYYVDNTEEQTAITLALARKHNLLPTGGSDFHGSYKPDIQIGKGRGNLHILYELVHNLKKCR